LEEGRWKGAKRDDPERAEVLSGMRENRRRLYEDLEKESQDKDNNREVEEEGED